jgi:hypothetical protein
VVKKGGADTKLTPPSDKKSTLQNRAKPPKMERRYTAKEKRARIKLNMASQAERDKKRFCGAKTKNGTPCNLPAGYATRHPGVGSCVHHGGNTPTHEISVAHKEVMSMATPVDVTPGVALRGVLNLAAGQLLYVSAKVFEVKESEVMSDIGINPWIRVQWRVMDNVARYAKIAADAGIDERLVSLAEEQNKMIAGLLEKIAEELNFTPEQKKALGPAIRRQLHALPDLEAS